MNTLDWILLISGIVISISICIYMIIAEIKGRVFERIGFVGSKEELYNITFEKFNFDYSVASGNDSNENQENLISEAVKQINTEDNTEIKKLIIMHNNQYMTQFK